MLFIRSLVLQAQGVLAEKQERWTHSHQDLTSLSLPGGQDVNDVWSFQHPQLYVPGQLNLYFSKKAFFKCALHSGYSSMVLFFIPYAAMYDTVRDDGKDVADYQSFALLTQTCLLFAVSIQAWGNLFFWNNLVLYIFQV